MTSRRTRTPAGVLVAVIALLSLSACYAVQPRPPVVERSDRTDVSLSGKQVREGGDLTMGLSAEPDVLDPTTSSSLYTRYVMNAICEKLYDIDAEGAIVPQLASALPSLSDGGRTVSIPLRDGIEFADGTAFDAAAVKTTLQRDLTKDDSSRAPEMGPIDAIETPDERTVVLRYKTPFAPITASLADRAGMIMSPAALKKLGDDFGNAPTCVGPFKFVNRVPQTSITVEKDPHYYDADEVKLDSITYRIMTDANIRAANLRSGEVQVIDTVSTQDVDSLRKQPGVGLLQVGSLGYQGVTFNIGNTKGVGEPPGKIDTPLAKDPRVRKAFEYVPRPQEPGQLGLQQLGRAGLLAHLARHRLRHAGQQRLHAVRPEEVESSCSREAGVKTPLHLEMAASNTPDTLRLAQALQALVKKGGFDLEIQPVEYSTLLDPQDRATSSCCSSAGRDASTRTATCLLPRHRPGPERVRLQQQEGRRPARQGRPAGGARRARPRPMARCCSRPRRTARSSTSTGPRNLTGLLRRRGRHLDVRRRCGPSRQGRLRDDGGLTMGRYLFNRLWPVGADPVPVVAGHVLRRPRPARRPGAGTGRRGGHAGRAQGRCAPTSGSTNR